MLDKNETGEPGAELNQTKPVYSVTHIYSTKQVTQEKRERKNTELDNRQQVTQGMRDRKNAKSKRKRTRPTAHTQLHTYSTTQVTHGMQDGKMQNQSGSEPDQPCILSYTHTRPHKSRKKTAWENWNTKVNQTSAKHSQGIKHGGYAKGTQSNHRQKGRRAHLQHTLQQVPHPRHRPRTVATQTCETARHDRT